MLSKLHLTTNAEINAIVRIYNRWAQACRINGCHKIHFFSNFDKK